MPITPALGGWRQENCKFNTSLDYTERPSLKKKKKKKTGLPLVQKRSSKYNMDLVHTLD
jgi:hypothetical protein